MLRRVEGRVGTPRVAIEVAEPDRSEEGRVGPRETSGEKIDRGVC